MLHLEKYEKNSPNVFLVTSSWLLGDFLVTSQWLPGDFSVTSRCLPPVQTFKKRRVEADHPYFASFLKKEKKAPQSTSDPRLEVPKKTWGPNEEKILVQCKLNHFSVIWSITNPKGEGNFCNHLLERIWLFGFHERTKSRANNFRSRIQQEGGK